MERMEKAMKNVHERVLPFAIERVQPIIAACWSGTDDDAFPRDVIASWRRNPPGAPDGALIPGVTEVGHGPYRFRLAQWDGATWRVRMASGEGWHGFDLASVDGGTRVTHTVEASFTGASRLVWSTFVEPIHDWCVEAIFDRMTEALASGVMPARTSRPIPPRAAFALRALRTFGPKSRKPKKPLPGGDLRDPNLAQLFA
jgi:hypothetical protein